MKRILSLLLVFLIFSNSLFVICYATDDFFVTKAITEVKKKIKIPENYTEFNSKLTIESGGQYAYFTWYGEEDGISPGGQISVVADSKLRIISFNQYYYGDFTGNYKLSDYTSDEAELKARDFISKACPEFYPYTKLWDYEYSVHRNFEPYEFRFIRYENNLPCYDNYINVKVNAENGEVSSFEVNWTDFHKIYPAKTYLSKVNASVHMYDEIGMIKEYSTKPDGSLYVRYTDLSDGINYINAYTGNIINTNYVSSAGTYKNAITSQKNFNFTYSENPFDLEYAIKVVEENEGIILGDKFTLTGVQYLKDNYSNYLYMYYEDGLGNVKIYIIDVLNGDIRHYDYYKSEIGTKNYNYSQQECEFIAQNFVYNCNKSFIGNCRLLNVNNTKNSNGEDIYYFNYTRYINDIAYDSNGVVVGVSRSTGDVVSVRSGWDSVDAMDYSLTISQGDAFEKYIDSAGFELQYVTSLSSTKEYEMRAVYAPNPMYDIYVDAVTGDITDKYGNIVKNEKVMYSDISDDISQEQITTLFACGILDEAEQFNPDENVLLNDYLLWMCRAIDCKNYKDINDIAQNLVDLQIVTYNDLTSNQPINTETAIKYIVSYLGYDNLARLTDTFKTDFVDEGAISRDMIGYAAIAKGLKIFQGNAFTPKTYVKRNVAAQIIYNLISN